MERRIAALGLVVVLLGAVVAVQLLDPQFGEEDPPEVDFSESPNEVAADAAKQFEYVDYTYRVDIKYGENDEWRQWRVTHVDHSKSAYRKSGPGGEREEVIYGTTTTAFVRPGINGDWVVVGHPDVIFPAESLTQPVYVERTRNANAHVVSENPSSVAIHVDVNPLKIEGYFPGNATIGVNRSTGIIESIHVRYNPNGSGTQYLRLQVIETGTTVERPEALGFSAKEVFWDLVRGPLFRIEWLL